MRPSEQGRQVIVRRSRDGATTDINPAEFNARTRVHEYGGGDYVVHDGVVYFSNFADQQLYRQAPNSAPQILTGIAGQDAFGTEAKLTDLRYADAVFDSKRARLICVREDHREENREAVNELVAISVDNGEAKV